MIQAYSLKEGAFYMPAKAYMNHVVYYISNINKETDIVKILIIYPDDYIVEGVLFYYSEPVNLRPFNNKRINKLKSLIENRIFQ